MRISPGSPNSFACAGADDIKGLRIPSSLGDADALFDSAAVSHEARWSNTYPTRSECFDYMQRSLEQIISALERSDATQRYFFQLALVHEDMHAEALAMTQVSLGLPLPGCLSVQAVPVLPARDLVFEGGALTLGGSSRSFKFDNELPAQEIEVAPFAISARPVTAAEFSAFAGKAAQQLDRAAMHISQDEAAAWCRRAGRRLPSEPEWEFAAMHSTEFFASTGQVWEWTASPFAPYPGFVAGPYKEYSEPWFHTHQVLKGGSFATHPRLKYPQYRNFYTPDRRDMFCGFRTCAID